MVVTSVATISASMDVLAQVAPRRPIASQAARPVFRARQAANSITFAVPAQAEPERPLWTLQVGGLYGDDGNGTRLLATPAEIRWMSSDKSSVIFMDIDLYDRLDTDSQTTRGHGDPMFVAMHDVPFGPSNSVTFGAGITVPAGSPLSSSHATQSGVAIFNHTFEFDAFAAGTWLKNGTVELWGIVDHQNQLAESTASSVAWTTKAYYYQHFGPDTDIFAVLAKTFQRGLSGAWGLGFGTDFTISDKSVGPFSKITGTLSAACNISGDRRCGTFEFDIQLPLSP